MDPGQLLAHLPFREGKARGKPLQGPLAGAKVWIEEEIGEQGFDESLASPLEERGAAADAPLAVRRALAADPVDDRTDVRVGARTGYVDPVEDIEPDRIAGFRIDRDDPTTHPLPGAAEHGGEFAGRIEDDRGAAIGQESGHADRDGLKSSGACEDEAVARVRGEIEHEKRGATAKTQDERSRGSKRRSATASRSTR